METRKRTIRNLIIFVIGINIFGWVAWMFAAGGDVDAQGLGLLIWLVSPLLVTILLRLFARDGWRDAGLGLNLKGNGRWYIFSLLLYPVIVAVILVIGALLGVISFSKDALNFAVQAVATALVFSLIKNFLEEFAWRGYLTPKLASLGLDTISGHLLTGIIWGTWHLPYYLRLLDRAELSAYTSMDLSVFIPLVVIGITASSIAFGEIRLLTGSVWPAVLMHAMSNLFSTTLITAGVFTISRSSALFFTPGMEGVLSIILIVTAGLWMYRKRSRSEGK